ncbi:MAG: ABC transporter permease [Lysobacterales bacterium]|nr:MAG: ABC transporter permease [Xanthomonadales bacterium]
MLKFIGRRLTSMIPLLILASFISFLILYLIPGDPVLAIQGNRPASPETINKIRAFYNLDQPFGVRYFRYVTSVLHGDFGTSLITRRPVTREIFEQLPSTLQLAASALVFGLVLGTAMGIAAAARRNSVFDSAIMSVAILGNSIPNLWLGLMLILIFAVQLQWLPVISQGTAGLVLPMIALGGVIMAHFARLTRSSLLEVLNQDFIRTARSKGLSERVIIIRHGLRNALLPLVSFLGMQIGELVTGSVVVETVFARRGVGKLIVDSVLDKDIPVVQAIVLMTAVAYMLANLVVDVAYMLLDPRIRDAR